MYAKATRRPWRTKPRKNDSLVTKQRMKPGDYIAVDMLASPTLGLMAQMTGILTRK